jgi:hypothetical protein
MANKLYNIAGMSTATVGIANLVLGAALPGMITFNNAGVLNADVVSYSIRDGINTEVGQGTYTSRMVPVGLLRRGRNDRKISCGIRGNGLPG